jgi:hypothetical protein
VHERKAVAGTLQHWLDPGKGIAELAGANKKAPLAKRLGFRSPTNYANEKQSLATPCEASATRLKAP